LKDYFEFKNADPELFTQAECEKKHAKEMKKQGRLTPDEYEKQQAKEMEKQEKEMKKKEAEEMKKHKTIDAQNTNQKSVSKIAEERGVKKVDAHAHDGAYESNESSSSDKARSNR
jgi:membrane protein involved in colicin uptake